jgi:hypothetical protein
MWSGAFWRTRSPFWPAPWCRRRPRHRPDRCDRAPWCVRPELTPQGRRGRPRETLHPSPTLRPGTRSSAAPPSLQLRQRRRPDDHSVRTPRRGTCGVPAASASLSAPRTPAPRTTLWPPPAAAASDHRRLPPRLEARATQVVAGLPPPRGRNPCRRAGATSADPESA